MFEQDGSAGNRIDFSVGHWTDNENLTGCTVVLFERPAPAVVDVRGGAPGTRETSLMGPGDLVQSVDAILLTGGSALRTRGGGWRHAVSPRTWTGRRDPGRTGADRPCGRDLRSF